MESTNYVPLYVDDNELIRPLIDRRTSNTIIKKHVKRIIYLILYFLFGICQLFIGLMADNSCTGIIKTSDWLVTQGFLNLIIVLCGMVISMEFLKDTISSRTKIIVMCVVTIMFIIETVWTIFGSVSYWDKCHKISKNVADMTTEISLIVNYVCLVLFIVKCMVDNINLD